MSRFNMFLVAALFGSSAAAAAVNMTELYELADPLVRRDPVPNKMGQCATYADLKWQPVLDFDTDGCYNVPAIGANGFLNPGMECNNNPPQGGCRDEWDLDNNQVYSRSRCNNGWCAHTYAYYFEKDFDQCWQLAGHKHDWEHIVVWTKGDQGRFVGVSAHGLFDVRQWDGVPKQDTHAKVVYHLGGASGTRTHSFRFANGDDDKKIENHKKRWFAGTLISYYGFPSVQLRSTMMNHNWGSASIEISDKNIMNSLKKSMNLAGQHVVGADHTIFQFQPGQDAPDGHNSPGRINGCGVSS